MTDEIKKLWIGLGLIVAFGSMIIGCEWKPASKKAADGYYFEKSQWTRTEFKTNIVLVPSRDAMVKEVEKRDAQLKGKIRPEDVAAFAVIHPFDTTCTIYILDPKVEYEPEYIGHELVHCIYGDWHGEPQK